MRPRLVGAGPPDASTCLALEAWPSTVWDVNGYYRELGVSPKATRLEIRRAYQAKRGQDSPRLTYIVKQLLNPETRREYDATPSGGVFFDEQWAEWVRQQMANDLSDARQIDPDVPAEPLDLSDQMNKAYTFDSGIEDRYSPRSAWQWSFFQWESECEDTERLSRLRAGVITALAASPTRPRHLSVGYYTLPVPWAIRRILSHTVVFLADDHDPEEEDFTQIARSLIHNDNHDQLEGTTTHEEHDSHGRIATGS